MYNKENLKPGHKFYYSNRDLYHIVTSFVDDGEEFFVIKCWLKYKGYWGYYVVSRAALEDWFEIHNK